MKLLSENAERIAATVFCVVAVVLVALRVPRPIAAVIGGLVGYGLGRVWTWI